MNPILQNLQSSQGNLLSRISQIKTMFEGRNADEIYADMIKNNQQFRSFVEQNKGKTAEQIAEEYGINLSLLK